jgi:hypothetical protein
MNTHVDVRTHTSARRWLLVLLLAVTLTATTFAVPALSPQVYACQGTNGGGC